MTVPNEQIDYPRPAPGHGRLYRVRAVSKQFRSLHFNMLFNGYEFLSPLSQASFETSKQFQDQNDKLLTIIVLSIKFKPPGN